MDNIHILNRSQTIHSAHMIAVMCDFDAQIELILKITIVIYVLWIFIFWI